MPAVTELARLKRDIATLVEAVAADIRPGSKSPMSSLQRRSMRAELEDCMQQLDELRNRLAG